SEDAANFLPYGVCEVRPRAFERGKAPATDQVCMLRRVAQALDHAGVGKPDDDRVHGMVAVVGARLGETRPVRRRAVVENRIKLPEVAEVGGGLAGGSEYTLFVSGISEAAIEKAQEAGCEPGGVRRVIQLTTAEFIEESVQSLFAHHESAQLFRHCATVTAEALHVAQNSLISLCVTRKSLEGGMIAFRAIALAMTDYEVHVRVVQ